MNTLKRSDALASEVQESKSDRGPVPYLIVALCWLLLAIAAMSLRVASPLWSPIFDWAFSQAVLAEQLIPDLTRWETYGVWLAAYAVLGVAAWIVVERLRNSGRAHHWRRAIISWLVIQLSYRLLSAVLIAKGVIGE
jgi:uncharacterized membrane protein YhaH (DUF805 family)